VGAALAAGAFKVCRKEQEEDADAEPSLQAKLLSEFIGTFMLVLTVMLNVLASSPAGAFSIAASLMCMIFALGSCSGAHFNPAVTTAIMCSGRGKCSLKDGAAYIGAQTVAGILAALISKAMIVTSVHPLNFDKMYSWPQTLAAEFVFTFVLAFVVLSVATVKSSLTEYFGFAIGMCVTVGGIAVGKVSGGSLNPAVSIALWSEHSIAYPWPCVAYVLVELVAGAAAAGMFMVTQPSEYATKAQEETSYGATA